MFNIKKLKVIEIISNSKDAIDLKLSDGSLAIAYKVFTPDIEIGDELAVNTTAVDLRLGTGGMNFVLANLNKIENQSKKEGHLMKLRYTPLQFSCLSVESQESEYHDVLKNETSLKGFSVAIAGLHSQLSTFAATAKYLNSEINIAYIMTDGASLPIAFSKTVDELKEKKLINSTITCGQSFGGDYEAVNIYSALLSAKYVAKADIAFVSMGPGVVGTATKTGTTAVEVGQTINAVNSLDGKAIVIPRVSFKDKRKRHRGISHHTLFALSKIALSGSTVTMPYLNKKDMNYVNMQISENKITEKHKVEFIKNDLTFKALKEYNLKPTTMGRGLDEVPEFFLASGCAAIKILSI